MASFGETLKQEREARQISLREIANATRINIRHLQALEQNRFETLPGGIFNKGFIRAYAAHIGIDGEAMVESYVREIAARDSEYNDVSRLPRPAPDETKPRRARLTDLDRKVAAITAIVEVDPKSKRVNRKVALSTKPSPVLLGLFSMIAVAGLVLLTLKITGSLPPSEPQIVQSAIGPPPPENTIEAETTTEPPVVAPEEERHADEPAKVALASPIDPEPQTRDEESDPAPQRPVRATPEPRRERPIPPPPARLEEPAPAPMRRSPPPQTQSSASEPVRTPPSQPVARPVAPGKMVLRLRTEQRTWVLLACDSRTVIDRRMEAGESMSFECLSTIRVSAHDAAAVRLWVNNAPCLPLGEAGSRVYGYTIRNDDFHLICPPR